MTFAQRRQERTALMANLLEQQWDVFGTLKFVNGRSIGRTSAGFVAQTGLGTCFP